MCEYGPWLLMEYINAIGILGEFLLSFAVCRYVYLSVPNFFPANLVLRVVDGKAGRAFGLLRWGNLVQNQPSRLAWLTGYVRLQHVLLHRRTDLMPTWVIGNVALTPLFNEPLRHQMWSQDMCHWGVCSFSADLTGPIWVTGYEWFTGHASHVTLFVIVII